MTVECHAERNEHSSELRFFVNDVPVVVDNGDGGGETDGKCVPFRKTRAEKA